MLKNEVTEPNNVVAARAGLDSDMYTVSNVHQCTCEMDRVDDVMFGRTS